MKGDRGQEGEKGETGMKGERGNTGPTGEVGPEGIEGPKVRKLHIFLCMRYFTDSLKFLNRQFYGCCIN